MGKGRLARLIVVLVVLGTGGCESRTPQRSAFLGPTPGPSEVASSPLVQFVEAPSGFSTSEVRDAGGHILRFSKTGDLIWPDASRIPGYPQVGSVTIGAQPLCECWLEVRFGTEEGERRAYLTIDYGHYNPGKLIRLELENGRLGMSETATYPPGSFTLSGIVTEVTPTGRVPVEGAKIYRAYGGGWQDATSDRFGFYQIHGLYARTDQVSAGKDGYATSKSSLTVEGDTRYDIELERR